MMNEMNNSCRIDELSAHCDLRNTVDVLRLDLLHPVVSGNKWFKLKHYLAEAESQQKTVLTFGGAFSNHIVATAFAAKEKGLKSIGVIRGEEPPLPSHTLRNAKAYGMELFFTNRSQYKSKIIPKEIFDERKAENIYVVPEGGYGSKGALGAKEILLRNDVSTYTHIVSAVGTGTTVAGLLTGSLPHQKVIGVSAFKNNHSLETEIKSLLPEEKKNGLMLIHDHHFGGYAKHTSELIKFMNSFYLKTGIPTDFVYTGKTFLAAFDLLSKGYFSAGDKILLLQTGGLQGNLSLPKGTLVYA